MLGIFIFASLMSECPQVGEEGQRKICSSQGSSPSGIVTVQIEYGLLKGTVTDCKSKENVEVNCVCFSF